MTTVEHRTIGYGDRGTADTLATMDELVSRGVDSPAIVGAARELVTRAGAGRDGVKQARAIRQWLSSVWRFVEDPSDRELLRDPAAMLAEYDRLGIVMGDCDEAAVLGAALGRAVGLEDSFTVLAFPSGGNAPDTFAHVYASLLTPAGVSVDLDVTRPAGPVPMPTRRATVSRGAPLMLDSSLGAPMPGALARGRREVRLGSIPFAWQFQTPYNMGLSWFPDQPEQLAPLGSLATDGVALAPVPYVGPVIAGAATAYGLYQSFTGGGGSAVDQARQARANYFGQLAMQGNVAAAQILLGAVPNVSGNEAPYWQSWISQLSASSTGQQTLAAAQSLGPYWPVGSSDTVQNYPIMKNFVAQWSAQNPFANLPASVPAALARLPILPLVLAGGAAVALSFALRSPRARRRRR